MILDYFVRYAHAPTGLVGKEKEVLKLRPVLYHYHSLNYENEFKIQIGAYGVHHVAGVPALIEIRVYVVLLHHAV